MNLKTVFCGIELDNPTVLASGILGSDSGSLIRVGRSGAGAVTMKSVGPIERQGHLNPNLVDFGGGMLNAVGLPSPGYKNIDHELEELNKLSVPFFSSFYGSSKEDFVNIARKLVAYRPATLEMDISCPNKSDGQVFAFEPDLAADLVSAVVKVAGGIPVIPKLSPNTHKLIDVAKACEEAGASGLCAINAASGMVINPEAARPVLTYKKGGISGPALKPISIRCVYELYENVKIPIIGTGGVSTGRDAVEMLMAGATLVGIGTAAYYRGIDAFRKITDEMKGWMKENGYEDVKELIGKAHDE